MLMVEKVEVYHIKSEGFSSQVDVVAAYVEVEGSILILQRSGSEKGFWGVPAGKVEQGENLGEAVKRELFEETGILVDTKTRCDSLGKLYIQKKDLDYTYHLYRLNFKQKPKVQLNYEHTNFDWLTPENTHNFSLMAGGKQAYEYYLKWSSRKHAGTSVNAYLILKMEDQVLLHLRKNTGYFDDYYGLVSGHVEDGESATQALIREAYEEAGITIDPLDLSFAHCLHRQTNRLNIDLFFECTKWHGEISNQEPDKCLELKFFPLNFLPGNTIHYVADVVKKTENGQSYSEDGWEI